MYKITRNLTPLEARVTELDSGEGSVQIFPLLTRSSPLFYFLQSVTFNFVEIDARERLKSALEFVDYLFRIRKILG